MTMRRIFYFCFSVQTPYGGIKKIYHHVDILNEMGYSAFVLHEKKNFRCRWFPNKTPIAYSSFSDPIGPVLQDDVLVLPENKVYSVGPLAKEKGVSLVVFNQNPYKTFTFTPYSKLKSRIFSTKQTRARDPDSPYQYKKLLGSMVVSNDSIEYLNFLLPHHAVYRIHLTIPFERFLYQKKKKKQIAFFTGKCNTHILQVVSILQERKRLQGWTFVPFAGVSEETVSDILKESAIFLSFSHAEGLPLLPLEAIACGCIVIGYTGHHSNVPEEYFKPPYAYPIRHADILGFVNEVEKIALGCDENKEMYDKQLQKAVQFIKDEFSAEKERQDIKNAWTAILGKSYG